MIHYGQKAILLIDEYDVPLQSAARHGFHESMAPFMGTLLARALKTTSDNLGLAVLAGTLPRTGENLFARINNVRCCDIGAVAFSDLFGFTQDEVDSLLAAEGIEDKRDVLKEWYAGYRFGNGKDIYSL